MKKALLLVLSALFVMGASKPLSPKKDKSNAVVVELNGVNEENVDAIIAKLDEVNKDFKEAQDSGKDPKVTEFWLKINSLGGSILDGQKLINKMADSKVKTICVVDTLALSMGAEILESPGCMERLGRKNSVVMFHEGSVGGQGDSQTMANSSQMLHKISESLCYQAAERMGVKPEVLMAKISHGQELWLDYKDLKAWPLFDRIISENDIPPVSPVEPKAPAFKFFF